MLMADNSLHLIQERRKALQAKRQEVAKALAQIDAEEADLLIAERVLSRLGTAQRETRVGNVEVQIKTVSDSIPRLGTTKRPANAPTTRAMFDALLAEAEATGLVGLDGKSLVVGIRNRWWPGAGWNNILPDAARLVKSGVLKRDGRLYVRQGKGPNAQASGPHRSPGVGTGTPSFLEPLKAGQRF
jgi:hypothetical protein